MQVHRAVNDAEAICGIQFCVVVCSGDGPVDEQGRHALADLGLVATPPVLIVLRVADGALTVTLGPGVDGRLTAAQVDDVLALCPAADFEDGRDRVAAIVLTLADRVGPGVPDPAAPELPDVITA